MLISSILVPGGARINLAKRQDRRRYVFQPETGSWTADSTGKAPWFARDLAFSIEIDGQTRVFARPTRTLSSSAQDVDIFGPGEATQYVLPGGAGGPTLRVVVTGYNR